MTVPEDYKTTLELIGYREQCPDGEAEEMRQLARKAVGMVDATEIRDRLNGEKGTNQ